MLACGTCGAELDVGDRRTTACPYCASPQIIERPPSRERPAPTFVLTFAAGADLPRKALGQWTSSQSIFADGSIKHARVEDLQGIYVPAYLYSAMARSVYSANIGEDYQETETYTDSEGNTQTRTVTRTEYRPLSGQHVGYVTDVVVTASRALHNQELEAIEPFDLRQLHRYDHALISGWIAEEPSRTPEECMTLAREEATVLEGRRLSAFMPGDSHKDLVYQTTVQWETLDPVLVPVWVLAVRYRMDKPVLRVLVNGQTGRAAGRAPLSPYRIGIAIALALIAVIGVAVMVSQ